ncbi:hypothetical protein DSOL_2865 [Desulfosporosinus metallidurans]|uniref:Uncharacterized protein n=1 Tax=Desulfosporosinus metallidurans TaxID=1888891 RepID=A0A1Q8QUR6_9FIRM|nr:hypothetical protein DSOL_2865 [Desulfosporosinus metallidurans]
MASQSEAELLTDVYYILALGRGALYQGKIIELRESGQT